jgi:hypothetical protein
MSIKQSGGPTAHVLLRAKLVRTVENEGIVVEFPVTDIDYNALYHHVSKIANLFDFTDEYHERVTNRILDLDLQRCLESSLTRIY